ncbi:hypothetical protein AKJ40_00655 [candidate division MSBL1 archaeon SCGC-AAA259M10]|uniref:ParB-like N-terminal domain-containing protein n=1 Tax=candidate division MSBL1 archaeon SCGC-AAA259M10 TaxID=1698270 RepID=A0A133V2Y4_9EURY|nr:hypothetical protein AKJ40_00655 [candidate division MSBL1 archaeon SCGC-AAA259M10]
MTTKEVSLGKLKENDYNPRKRFDDAKMEDLKKSIEKVGLAQPLTVRGLENGDYEVVCGVRRLRALNELYSGNKKIPVNELELSDQEAKVLSLTENVARDNLTKIEEARAYAKYITSNGYETNLLDEIEKNVHLVDIPSKSHKQVKELANQIGKYTSPSTIGKRLKLLILPEEIQNAVESGEIKIKVAQVITQLRKLDDSEFAERKMKELANDPNYRGSSPNLEGLRKEVGKILEKQEEQKEKSEQKLKKFKTRARERKTAVEEQVEEIKEKFDISELEKVDSEDVVEIGEKYLEILQNEINNLTTGDRFDNLQDEQLELEDREEKLKRNLKEVTNNNLSRCPYCDAPVSADDLKNRIGIIEDQITGIQEERSELSETKTELTEARRGLRKEVKSHNQLSEKIENLQEEVE